MSAAKKQQGPEFEIRRVSIALGNTDHVGRRSFGQAEILIGPFKVAGYVLPDGTVSLPSSMTDASLRARVSVALRCAVQAQTAAQWERQDHRDVARILPANKQTTEHYDEAVREICAESAWA